MTERDTSRPGLVANLVFAALWLSLGIWTVATPGPPLRWLMLLAYVALATGFVVVGVRRHRGRRAAEHE